MNQVVYLEKYNFDKFTNNGFSKTKRPSTLWYIWFSCSIHRNLKCLKRPVSRFCAISMKYSMIIFYPDVSFSIPNVRFFAIAWQVDKGLDS